MKQNLSRKISEGKLLIKKVEWRIEVYNKVIKIGKSIISLSSKQKHEA